MSDTDSSCGPALVTPTRLVERFCHEPIVSAQGAPDETGVTGHRGFCGVTLLGPRDPMISGFDEGYDLLNYLSERGWRPLPSKGDWPYLVYLKWVRSGEKVAIAEYCEGDLAVRVFDDPELAARHYAGLPDIP